MQNSKRISTSMASNVLRDKDEKGIEIDITKYRGIIRHLLYLTMSMPYITFSVCMCARFQALPMESHFKIIKIILRYINGTSHHDLWLPKGSECSLLIFFDSNFASCNLDMKIIIGVSYFFGNRLVS